MMPRQAKRHMLENIQRNMASLKVNGALSSQLASYAVMRDERSGLSRRWRRRRRTMAP